MARALRIFAFTVIGLIAFAALAWIVLFYTGPGRNFMIARAEPAIGSALGGDAAIGALKGAPPAHLILEDISIIDAEGEWAHVDRLELRWRPLQLLIGKRIVIDDAALTDGRILRPPPQKSDEKDKTDEPFAIKLPDGLPELRIDTLQISNLQSELAGVSTRIDGVGAILMGGRRLRTELNLTSANDADTIDIAVDIAPNAERVFIDATIAAQENGVIAAFADLGGPLLIDINADSPASKAEISVKSVIGAYGEADAVLLANLENLVSVNADGVFTAGERLADIRELSEPVRFNIYLQDEENGGRVTINRLFSAIGAIAGDIAWQGERKNSNRFTADLRASLDGNYRPELQDYFGDEVTLQAQLQRRPEDYAISALLRGLDATIEVKDGATDLRSRLAGALTASFAERDDFPKEGAQLQSQLDLDLRDAARFSSLRLSIGESLNAAGNAEIRFEDDWLSFDGDIDAAPGFISSLAPSLAPMGVTTANVEASGKTDLFTLKANILTPDIMMGDNRAPALTAEIALAGLPSLPTGEIAAKALEGLGAFKASLRSHATGRIDAPSLHYQGQGFSLDGSGGFNPSTQTGEIDLRYEGGPEAEPWPGLLLAGAFDAKGGFARQGARTDLTVTTRSLRANAVQLSNFTLRANGPPDKIDTTLNAGELLLGGNRAISDLAVATTINARKDVSARFTQLDAAIADNKLKLLEPGVISFADGVAIDNLRLGWSRQGRIAIDGAFTDARWRGDFAFDDVNIPETDGRADIALSLDTNEETPATGTFSFRSLISDSDASISGDLRWDGEALVLTSAPGEDGLDMQLALPAKLTRKPSVSVNTDGEINGHVRYDGAVEPFAAFMPPELQTLEGKLNANLTIAGTTNAPELSGVAALSEGAYTELRSGLSVDSVHARAEASFSNGDGSRIAFSGGASGGGQSAEDTIRISGDMRIGDETAINLAIDLDNAEFSAHPVNTARASGRVEITGSPDDLAAKGRIDVAELDAEIVTPETTGLVPIEVVNIDDVNGGNGLPDDGDTSIDLDIVIVADNRIFIRGRGLESEWSANARAVTERKEALILGDMTLRRGALDFSGRRFDLTQGKISFDRLSPNNPLLALRAEFETSESVTAAIVISGRAQEPSIELTSTPSLPQEDVMALVLFGKQANELTAFESLQAAQALASLGGIGPFGGDGLTGSVRRATGLDMVNFDVDPENGGGSLTVGKYVTDGLFVSATQDAQGKGGAVIVEYDITDNISVETEIRQDGDQTVSANWKKDF